MRCIMVMFDSLNRHMLPPYGCDWTDAPNFRRLAERTVTFDRSYVCSMPCMPARRDLLTGRPNFLHRSWGPIEPFDDSMPAMLRDAGVHSALITDHQHYFEPGGCTYHTQYSTWQFNRGQEGDAWMGQVWAEPVGDVTGRNAETKGLPAQDRINRKFLRDEAALPQSKTFAGGIDFIRRNHGHDNWFVQIETFDPHEPFFSPQKYKDRYAAHYDGYDGPGCDWPVYAKVTEPREVVEHVRHEYASLLSMCDSRLGDVLDTMDELNLWDDTMLIVWTDHGFMLGEHECWAKVWMPFYQEVANTPFFVWDPRSGKRGERREALVQPSIDLAPTLLRFFGVEPTKDMLGKDLAAAIDTDASVREAAMFGVFGGQLNVTDGKYVYMRAKDPAYTGPLYEHTLMPTHMNRPFAPAELQDRIELAEPMGFTKGCRTMRIRLPDYGKSRAGELVSRSYLFDVENDPRQTTLLDDAAIEKRMIAHLVGLMRECESPKEQFERAGLER